jgi:UDP-N-acetylglucosamine:LPS N-acetylglucosamine transferase
LTPRPSLRRTAKKIRLWQPFLVSSTGEVAVAVANTKADVAALPVVLVEATTVAGAVAGGDKA